MNRFKFLFTILLFSLQLNAQSWETLPNAPVTSSRIDDVSFISPQVGWIAERGGSQQSGRVWRTTDGGDSWTMVFEPEGACFRCIAFTDSLHGWVGLLGTEEFCFQTDTNVIYYTINGGGSWFPVTSLNGPKPRGLCGMQVVDDSVIVAVGRVRGPAFFMKSTDRGMSWVSKDMNAYAYGLVDVHFFTPDSGIAVGLTDSTNEVSSGIVLSTADGGETWDTSYVSSQLGEWCWKITFPTRLTGYVSLQRNSGSPVNVLKTTDGGASWTEEQLSDIHYYVQGIGFIDETTGWVGGQNTNNSVHGTTDGGSTWNSAGFGRLVNRFQFLPNGEGYAVGQTVYKYTTVTSAEFPSNPESYVLQQNYPNPFNPSTVIEFDLPARAFVSLKIYDLLGQEVATLVEEEHDAGHRSVTFDASGIPAGVYFYALRVGGMTEVRKMVYLR